MIVGLGHWLAWTALCYSFGVVCGWLAWGRRKGGYHPRISDAPQPPPPPPPGRPPNQGSGGQTPRTATGGLRRLTDEEIEEMVREQAMKRSQEWDPSDHRG